MYDGEEGRPLTKPHHIMNNTPAQKTKTPSARATTVRTRRAQLIGADLERCIYCRSTAITKKGKRHKKHETIQLWYCKHCATVFTPQIAKGKTYPLKVILEALILYYHGHTTTQATKRIKERFGITISTRTLAAWLAEYRHLTAYAPLRQGLARTFTPRQLIRSARLHHKQVYMFRTHRGKLDLLLARRRHQSFTPLDTYLTDMATDCPHHLFQEKSRASSARTAFDLAGVEITERRNLAPRIARLALNAATHNKLRHDTVQRFMLATDAATVAMEVPIYLTPEDIAHLQHALGFAVPLVPETTLTGHIDLLQLRGGAIHILDYKPNAMRERPITQLMIYALALSRRTGLRLFDFVCAWFDEQHYFEFYPLHVVHKRRART